MELKAFYSSIGEDYDTVYRRLLSAERTEKYLTHFFQSNSIADLSRQISDNDIDQALNTAHSLKGVIATLGFDHLADTICRLHGVLKNNETEKAGELCCRVMEEYETICREWRSTYTAVGEAPR